MKGDQIKSGEEKNKSFKSSITEETQIQMLQYIIRCYNNVLGPIMKQRG